MLIFYDFETSSRDILGQILSFSFICVDEHFRCGDEINGLIKLNRTQLPEIDALLTNKLRVDDLQKNGLREYDAAKSIRNFLENIINKHKTATLVGFNSNQFDLQFLRNLLIRYGLDPYFKGKLKNLDVLHFAQSVAWDNQKEFPWILKQGNNGHYYSFKLEDLVHAFSITTTAQTHQARDDVKLTITLTQTLTEKFKTSLLNFKPFRIPKVGYYDEPLPVGKTKNRDFGKDKPDFFVTKYFKHIKTEKAQNLVVDLDKIKALRLLPTPSEEDLLKSISYINANKSFFQLESCNEEEIKELEDDVHFVMNQPFYKTLDIKRYFEKIQKPWDIEYQIHLLGFNELPILGKAVADLDRDPDSYEQIFHQLWQRKKTASDRYLVQLFNRAYLNLHPSPKPDHLTKYCHPRYLTGAMLRDKESFVSSENYLEDLNQRITEADNSSEDAEILKQLSGYANQFFKKLKLTSAS